MTKDFGQLTAPNYSAKTSFADFAGYFFGGFLLSLPFLPISQIRSYFAIFTFCLYALIILTLATVDFVKAVNSARLSVWQIELVRIKMVVEI